MNHQYFYLAKAEAVNSLTDRLMWLERANEHHEIVRTVASSGGITALENDEDGLRILERAYERQSRTIEAIEILLLLNDFTTALNLLSQQHPDRRADAESWESLRKIATKALDNAGLAAAADCIQWGAQQSAGRAAEIDLLKQQLMMALVEHPENRSSIIRESVGRSRGDRDPQGVLAGEGLDRKAELIGNMVKTLLQRDVEEAITLIKQDLPGNDDELRHLSGLDAHAIKWMARTRKSRDSLRDADRKKLEESLEWCVPYIFDSNEHRLKQHTPGPWYKQVELQDLAGAFEWSGTYRNTLPFYESVINGRWSSDEQKRFAKHRWIAAKRQQVNYLKQNNPDAAERAEIGLKSKAEDWGIPPDVDVPEFVSAALTRQDGPRIDGLGPHIRVSGSNRE